MQQSARILVVGDMHFSQRSFPIIDQLCKQILSTIDEEKPDHVVFLGDTLDRFGSISSYRSEEATEFLYQVTLRVTATVLIGNHDIPNKTLFMSKTHGFVGLTHYWPITIVDRCCVEFTVNGFVFQAVPYCPNGRLQEGLATLPNRNENPAAIFCHQEIKGCNMNGIDSIEGDVWPLTAPLLICGHIHLRHSPQVNVDMPGSPYQDNFGEDVNKSISLYTFAKDSHSKRFIDLDLPKKYKLVLTSSEYKKWEYPGTDLYQIKVVGTALENSKLLNSKKTKKIKADGGIVLFENVKSNEESVTKEEYLAYTTKSLEDVIRTSIQEKDYLHKYHLKAFGRD